MSLSNLLLLFAEAGDAAPSSLWTVALCRREDTNFILKIYNVRKFRGRTGLFSPCFLVSKIMNLILFFESVFWGFGVKRVAVFAVWFDKSFLFLLFFWPKNGQIIPFLLQLKKFFFN